MEELMGNIDQLNIEVCEDLKGNWNQHKTIDYVSLMVFRDLVYPIEYTKLSIPALVY